VTQHLRLRLLLRLPLLLLLLLCAHQLVSNFVCQHSPTVRQPAINH
jgi:hypothetical protein